MSYETHESSSLLGAAGSSSQKRRWFSATTQKRGFLFLAFSTAVFGLFPTSLKLVFGEDSLRHEFLYGGCFVIFLLAVGTAGNALRKENQVRQRGRDAKKKYETVMDSTYKCIQPQILGSMVVASVKIQRRDAATDRVLTISDDCVTAELAQNAKKYDLVGADNDPVKREALKSRVEDTDRRMTNMISDLMNGADAGQHWDRKFQVKVFSGGQGGPTGLAFAVSKQGYGPTLASVVGTKLEMNRAPIGPPPGRGKTE